MGQNKIQYTFKVRLYCEVCGHNTVTNLKGEKETFVYLGCINCKDMTIPFYFRDIAYQIFDKGGLHICCLSPQITVEVEEQELGDLNEE